MLVRPYLELMTKRAHIVYHYIKHVIRYLMMITAMKSTSPKLALIPLISGNDKDMFYININFSYTAKCGNIYLDNIQNMYESYNLTYTFTLQQHVQQHGA